MSELLIFAFLAGIVSFLSPCVLPLVPAFLTYLAGTNFSEATKPDAATRHRVLISTITFVLGFSLVFSLMGVLLQSVLSSAAYDLQVYLGYIGGAIIIAFGLLLLGVLKIPFLQQEHKFKIKRGEKASYTSSFAFGAAFAVGWTPCAGAVLGSILTLAVTQPAAALPGMVAYSLGLGLPFLLVGIFLSRSDRAIRSLYPYLTPLNKIFGIILVVLGILVFTGMLSRFAYVAETVATVMG